MVFKRKKGNASIGRSRKVQATQATTQQHTAPLPTIKETEGPSESATETLVCNVNDYESADALIQEH